MEPFSLYALVMGAADVFSDSNGTMLAKYASSAKIALRMKKDTQHKKKPTETCELHLTAKLISATFITRRFLSVLQTSNMIDIF